MIRKFKNIVLQNLINIPGYRTNRKIIVFESDDWGMIRMSSAETIEKLKNKGYKISQCPYNSNDHIESDEDIKALAETLLSVKDSKSNPAKFTINNVVANPDFNKIKESNFKNYHYKIFTDTLKENKDSQNVMSLYKEGIKNNIFQPQLHGREHINLRLWLKRLQESDPKTTEAFNHDMYTIHHSGSISGRRDNLDAFGNKTITGDNFDYNKIVKEAQRIFTETWGFKSKSFIAPCYVWHPSLEKVLKDEGIRYIQGVRVQVIPIDNTSFQIEKKYHYTGQKNKLDQSYLIRNCKFEPTESGRNNVVENTLKEIKLSFSYKKPAIISSHRVNYIGSLNPNNRKQNLKLLDQLLITIIKLWPDAEFMSSDQLGDLITKTNKCVE
jgi:hypothetical protein